MHRELLRLGEDCGRRRVRGQNYKTREEAMADIFDYIETFYNRQRLHSSLDYLSPEEYELLYHQRQSVA